VARKETSNSPPRRLACSNPQRGRKDPEANLPQNARSQVSGAGRRTKAQKKNLGLPHVRDRMANCKVRAKRAGTEKNVWPRHFARRFRKKVRGRLKDQKCVCTTLSYLPISCRKKGKEGGPEETFTTLKREVRIFIPQVPRVRAKGARRLGHSYGGDQRSLQTKNLTKTKMCTKVKKEKKNM